MNGTASARIWALWVGGGLVANFAWEMLQMPLYGKFAGGWWRCFQASLGDVALLAVLYALMACAAEDWTWFERLSRWRLFLLAALGFLIAVLIEQRALLAGTWTYPREACKLHEATLSPALARLVTLFMPDTPPEIAREGLLHTWRSFNGTLRNVVLAMPIAIPLRGIGPKVTFVHGRADPITPLERVRTLAAATGAQVLVTEDDHLSYPAKSAGRILAAMEAP